MVPIPDVLMVRRHRILETEMNYVMKAVHYRLGQIALNEGIGEETVELFKTLWRFNRHKPGPPGYPEEITELQIAKLLAATRYLRTDSVTQKPAE